MAPLDHRLFVLRWALASRRWPNRTEWRFLIIGRWKGF